MGSEIAMLLAAFVVHAEPVAPAPSKPEPDYQTVVVRTLANHARRFRACIERDPFDDTRRTINLDIDGAGRPSRVEVRRSSGARATQVDSCLVSAARALTFPPPPNNEPFKVSYPLVICTKPAPEDEPPARPPGSEAPAPRPR